MSSNGYHHDRIEVVALPMPADMTTAMARVEKCIAYNEAERAARLLISDPVVAKSWFIPEDFRGLGSGQRLFIIVDLQEGWEDALASRECVSWYSPATDRYGQFYEIPYDRCWDEEYWWELEEPDSSVPHGEPLRLERGSTRYLHVPRLPLHSPRYLGHGASFGEGRGGRYRGPTASGDPSQALRNNRNGMPGLAWLRQRREGRSGIYSMDVVVVFECGSLQERLGVEREKQREYGRYRIRNECALWQEWLYLVC